ncbi:MAG: hypothetical protein K0R67_68 [Paenibacillus sp.]|nr:hypothetical protein [Paenibacillus sp.]
MSEHICGLRLDYTSNNGNHHLQIDRTPELREEDLISIQVEMLNHNKIPRLLHVEVEQVDHTLKLLYEIGGKKMLAHRLRRERLTQDQYLRLMLHTVSALADCSGYMLDSDNVMLNKHYIFTGNDITDLFFTYIPLRSYAGEVSIHEQLRQFSSQCLASIASMEGDQIPQVLLLLGDDLIRFGEMKERLLTLVLSDSAAFIGINPPTATHAHDFETPVLSKPRPAWISYDNPSSIITPSPNSQSAKPLKITPSLNSNANSKGANDDLLSSPSIARGPVSWMKRIRELKDEVGPSSNTGELPIHRETGFAARTVSVRKSAYLVVASLAIICFMWSFYTDTTSRAEFLLILFGSFIIAVVTALAVRARPKWLLNENGVESSAVSADDIHNEQSENQMLKASEASPVTNWHYPQAVPSMPSANMEKAEPASTLIERIPLSQHQQLATVLLESSLNGTLEDEETSLHYPWLEISKDSGSPAETIMIETDSFIIGRVGGHDVYCLDKPGVSKHHLEIMKRSDSYYAQDLGSTNGTTWNGERMIPYKSYPLANGDKLCIIRTQFVFKTE